MLWVEIPPLGTLELYFHRSSSLGLLPCNIILDNSVITGIVGWGRSGLWREYAGYTFAMELFPVYQQTSTTAGGVVAASVEANTAELLGPKTEAYSSGCDEMVQSSSRQSSCSSARGYLQAALQIRAKGHVTLRRLYMVKPVMVML